MEFATLGFFDIGWAGHLGRALVLALVLPACCLAAANAEEPPAFRGASRQFTLIVPPRKAPELSSDDADGRPVTLERDLEDKVVLINFWATWCAPCVIELPTLNKLRGEIGGERFAVLAIGVDRSGMEAIGPFWRERKLDNLVLRLDPRARLMREMGVRGLPTTFLIDHEGTMIGYLEGHADWASPEARSLIRFYLDRAASRPR
jgi:thiol-disulfide isomerase/thioredoxin